VEKKAPKRYHQAISFLTAGVFVALALVLAACGPNDDTKPLRAPDIAFTEGGEVKAVDRLGMRSYFAMPFAAPPVGDLRWTAPAPATKWTSRLEKTASAAPCLQTSASPFRLSGDSEDCLYLDVHAPTGAGPFPVMVNLHGGAFNTGGTSVYADPSPLVARASSSSTSPIASAPWVSWRTRHWS